MRFAGAFVLIGLGSVTACEKESAGAYVAVPARTGPSRSAPTDEPAPEVPPPPAARVAAAPALVRAPEPEPERPAQPVTRRTPPTGPLPEPPSVEPAVYKAWLEALPRGDRRRVSAFCRKHRTDYQSVCGGIGPLHIPYPPFPRAHMKRDDDETSPHSLFASSEVWQRSLTGAQRAYIDRECRGGEDQPSSDLCGDNTPLVVAFDREPIVFAPGGAFAFQAGVPTATDWPTAATPWIAFDRDGDGAITGGGELFGSDTMLPGGTTAVHGFQALAALDANHDGRIDALDPAFGSLVLWADLDGDQRSRASELIPLSQTILSISLASHVDARCDARGNCEGERAAIVWRDPRGTLRDGAVVDVYLPRR